MTRMRNFFLGSAAMIAALAITMSSCSNEELTEGNDQPEMKGISSVTLETPQNGPSTRLEYNIDNITNGLGVKWKAGRGEKGVCINATSSRLYGAVFVRTDEGEAAPKAEFTFYNFAQNAKLGQEQGSIGLLYPYKTEYAGAFDVNGSNAKSIEASLTLSGQSGRLADVENFDYMTAIAAVPEKVTFTDANLNIAFKHRIAIMRLVGLIFPDGIGSTATNVSISGTGLKTDAKFTFTKGANNTLTESLELGSTGSITTTGSFNITDNVLEDVYICFFPGNADASGTYKITDLEVTATVGGDTYKYDYGNDTTVPTKVTKFEEGKMYTLKGKNMTK